MKTKWKETGTGRREDVLFQFRDLKFGIEDRLLEFADGPACWVCRDGGPITASGLGCEGIQRWRCGGCFSGRAYQHHHTPQIRTVTHRSSKRHIG